MAHNELSERNCNCCHIMGVSISAVVDMEIAMVAIQWNVLLLIWKRVNIVTVWVLGMDNLSGGERGEGERWEWKKGRGEERGRCGGGCELQGWYHPWSKWLNWWNGSDMVDEMIESCWVGVICNSMKCDLWLIDRCGCWVGFGGGHGWLCVHKMRSCWEEGVVVHV